MRRTLRFLLLATLFPATAMAAVRLELPSFDAEPGERISVVVRVVVTGSEDAASIANDLSFDPTVFRPVPSPDGGYPNCSLASDLDAFLASFFFLPPRCEPDAGDCSGVRALTVLLELGPPPVARRDLYHCLFDVTAGARPGNHRITVTNASYTTSEAVEGPVQSIGGIVRVSRNSIPTDTPAPATPTPRPTLRLLAAECTGDCAASGSVEENEESDLVRAVFDTLALSSCSGGSAEADTTTTAAHLLAAVRAHVAGCVLPTATRTPRSSATRTPSPTPSLRVEETPPDTPVPTATTAVRTRTPTITPSPTRTRRPSLTPTRTRASTPTITPTNTRPRPTMTATPGDGPRITMLGIARADGRVATPVDEIDGVPVFEAVTGVGFKIVVEGAPAPSLIPVGTTTFVADASAPPHFQAVVSQALGNGSRRVCNGGVPEVEPPDFTAGEDVVDALNDFGCHFATGQCLSYSDGTSHYYSPQSTIQFCTVVGNSFRFGRGETRITVRLLDRNGTAGEPAAIVVRVPG